MYISAVPEPDQAEAFERYVEAQRAAWGFVPDYTGCFASRPRVADAWLELAKTIREPMDRRRFELVTVAAARARRSTYCAVAHSKFLRDVCDDQPTLDALLTDPTGETLSEEDAAVYRFASQIARDPASIVKGDIDALRAVGLDDAAIADIAYTVGLRLFFTTVLDSLGAHLDAATAAEFDSAALDLLTVGRKPGPS